MPAGELVRYLVRRDVAQASRFVDGLRLSCSPAVRAVDNSEVPSVLFGEEDVKSLRVSHDVVNDEVEAILDVWYGFVGTQPHLPTSFTGKNGRKPLDYPSAVRRRLGQWILDTARAEYDQKSLDSSTRSASRTSAQTNCLPNCSCLTAHAASRGQNPRDWNIVPGMAELAAARK